MSPVPEKSDRHGSPQTNLPLVINLQLNNAQIIVNNMAQPNHEEKLQEIQSELQKQPPSSMFDNDFVQDRSFVQGETTFSNSRYKFRPRKANKLEEILRDLMVEHYIDLPVRYLTNPQGLPFYLIGPHRYILNL